MQPLRRAARIAAHLIVFLLAAAWATGADISLSLPSYDLDRPAVGAVIESVARTFDLSWGRTVMLAHMVAGFKLALGLYLFAAVINAAYDRLRWGWTDDAMLDVGLFFSALGSGVAAVALVTVGGSLLVGALGEIMLCAMAGALLAYGHGAQWRMADLRPHGDVVGDVAGNLAIGRPIELV